MASNAAINPLKDDLFRMLDNVRCELDRIEILIAALNGFSRPVPDYEPRFRHVRQFGLTAHELGKQAGKH